MSEPTTTNERLARLTERGVSIWLDQIRRSTTEGGELRRLIDELSLRGETSNPSIFEKAILGSDDYDDELRELAGQGLDAQGIFRRISVHDVQLACDVLRTVYDELDGADGFCSLEVSPALARDTAATLEEARALWREVDRPNVMIKIPGTPEGLGAIEEATYDGINVNVTLLFSVERYADVAEAWIRGMERRHAEGRSVDDIASVASFFVSRVDTLVDRRLSERGEGDELKGKAGLANARAAYRRFEEIFRGERFAALREAGARVQRPLWASTGVKNPAYPDTLYVDGLVAPDTVNTMPMATILAAAEKAEAPADTSRIDPTEDLAALAAAGIDLEQVTEQLLEDGIDLFVQAFDGLIAGVESEREAIVVGRPPTIESSIPDDLEPALAKRVEQAAADEVARRVWARDPTLWGGDAGTPELSDRLGWLNISDTMLEHLSELEAFAERAHADGLTETVLLGMGGSSLGPEVLRRSFDAPLHVLDSTDPAAVLAVEDAVDLEHTLFVVSSKSGGTVETLSHFAHFFERTGRDGSRFVAVTDGGSPLDDLAAEHGFRGVFRNDPEIGGRYSVLSYFGLVPAALAGAPVRELLDRAQVAEQNCATLDPEGSNSGLWLGAALGELANQGRDKLTLVVDPPVDSFGLWAEQLVAESTGKHGRGIVPVPAEPLGGPEAYGDDRVFVHLRDDDAGENEAVTALARAGQPVLTLSAHGAADLGRLFFFSEFAVAVAGWALGINPFDQPNVQEAKDATKEVLASGDVDAPAGTPDDLLALLDSVAPPGYVSLHGYVAPSDEVDAAADELRAAIRDRTRAAVTYGYGPRFLHSTGQLHKGGPPTGHFVQFLHDSGADVDIPGQNYSFRTLKHAQATGDLRTLKAHDLPVVRLALEGEPAAALRDLAKRVRGETG